MNMQSIIQLANTNCIWQEHSLIPQGSTIVVSYMDVIVRLFKQPNLGPGWRDP